MPEALSKDDWIQEHEWLLFDLLRRATELAKCGGTVPGPTQKGYDLALQLILAHGQGERPDHLSVVGRGGVGTIPYALYAASRAEVRTLREALAKGDAWRPEFDAMSPRQEELAIQFCQEIAGRRGEAGSAPDPVRLLEMAQQLYEAERNDNLRVLQIENKPAEGAGP